MKIKPAKPFLSYKQGGKDSLGNTIYDILYISDRCMVYVYNEAGVIRFEGDKTKTHRKLDPLLVEISSLLISPKDRKIFGRRYAAAFGAVSMNEESTALSILKDLKKGIQGRHQLHSRLSYLSTALGFTLVTIVVCFLCWLFNVPNDVSINKTVHQALQMIVIASVSAFISVSFNLRRYYIDPTAALKIHVLSGLTRMLIALGSSGIGLLLFKADIFLSLLGKNEWGIYVVVAVSAFNEQLVPTTLLRLHDDEQKTA